MSALALLSAELKARNSPNRIEVLGSFLARGVITPRYLFGILCAESFYETRKEHVAERDREGRIMKEKFIPYSHLISVAPMDSEAAAALLTDAETEARIRYGK